MVNFEDEIRERCVLVTTSSGSERHGSCSAKSYLLCDESKNKVVDYANGLINDVREAQKNKTLLRVWNRIRNNLIPPKYTENNLKLPQVVIKRESKGELKYVDINTPTNSVWFDDYL